ncbi:MAG: glutamate racemase [Candidatus Kerfeldbacteria bacterium]
MIGVFDSGVGGLSIFREVRTMLPNSDFVYFGDTANVPYGGRPNSEIVDLGLRAVQLLRTYTPDLIIVACNTATSVAIANIREANPDVPIVGVVPVLKTASEHTKTGRFAVLATEATLKSASYLDLKQRFAKGKDVLEQALPEWVTYVEKGELNNRQLIDSIRRVAEKCSEFGADIAALGCTHFPFLRPRIKKTMPEVEVLDSGPAVARQVVRVLTANRTLPEGTEKGNATYLCSGDPEAFSSVASLLLGELVTVSRQ